MTVEQTGVYLYEAGFFNSRSGVWRVVMMSTCSISWAGFEMVSKVSNWPIAIKTREFRPRFKPGILYHPTTKSVEHRIKRIGTL
ncbi:unnamed protein product [Blepharisma stoltei]|uniref:Uncharacterized protein n=1 Tax=Blepharisma stoltei TaxID=1481888 RepID=A0AAU9JFV6_9CILI|nr:unnamed protein product [Blepharisma stoltei]